MTQNLCMNSEETNRKELEDSLFYNMKQNSAPELDGFTVKFIKTFRKNLRPIITNAMNTMKKKQTHHHSENSHNETAKKGFERWNQL